jgi:hypothetical protein
MTISKAPSAATMSASETAPIVPHRHIFPAILLCPPEITTPCSSSSFVKTVLLSRRCGGGGAGGEHGETGAGAAGRSERCGGGLSQRRISVLGRYRRPGEDPRAIIDRLHATLQLNRRTKLSLARFVVSCVCNSDEVQP